MKTKRLVGVVTVKQGLAVQSFGFNSYLPIGDPVVAIENLDRWGADEILLQCIDRSSQQLGPDLQLLEHIASKGISTPLIYSGGINSVEDAVNVVKSGADRIAVTQLAQHQWQIVAQIADKLGSQAIILALPLIVNNQQIFYWDYIQKQSIRVPETMLELVNQDIVSEVMLVDVKHEGYANSYDEMLYQKFPLDSSFLLFGGLSDAVQISRCFADDRVSAAVVGNFLYYQEHALPHLKNKISHIGLRPDWMSLKNGA